MLVLWRYGHCLSSSRLESNETKLRTAGLYDHRHRTLAFLSVITVSIGNDDVIPWVFQLRGWRFPTLTTSSPEFTDDWLVLWILTTESWVVWVRIVSCYLHSKICTTVLGLMVIYTTKSKVYLYSIARPCTTGSSLDASGCSKFGMTECSSASTSKAFWNYYHVQGHGALVETLRNVGTKKCLDKKLAFPICTGHWLIQPWKSRCPERTKLTKKVHVCPVGCTLGLLQPCLLVQLSRYFNFSGL